MSPLIQIEEQAILPPQRDDGGKATFDQVVKTVNIIHKGGDTAMGNYDTFKREMDEFVSDIMPAYDVLKELYETFEFKDLLETYHIVYSLYLGASSIAVEIGLDKEKQHDFLVRWMDEFFVFDNWFEDYDAMAFGLVIDGMEKLVDAIPVNLGKKMAKKMAKNILKKELE